MPLRLLIALLIYSHLAVQNWVFAGFLFQYSCILLIYSNIMLWCCQVHDFYQQPFQWMPLMLCPMQQMVAWKTESYGALLQKNTSRSSTSTPESAVQGLPSALAVFNLQ